MPRRGYATELTALAVYCAPPFLLWEAAEAQESSRPVTSTTASTSNAEVPEEEDWAIHGQSTFEIQYHPRFPSPFTGPNGLHPSSEAKETFDATLFAGFRPWKSAAEIWVNGEVDQGFGLSNPLGIAGFPTGTAFKVGAASPYPRLHRYFFRQTIELGGEVQSIGSDANQLAGTETADRLVLTFGKLSLTDIFDHNAYSDDPRHHFLNWSIFDAGSWDYAANAWGFTYAGTVEWYQAWWTIRSGIADLSAQPNTKELDPRLFDQYQLNEEIEERHHLFGRSGAVRLLGFLSHGRMGKYDDATAIALATGEPADITTVRHKHNRGGVSLSIDQALTDDLGLFARAGWNEGQYEAFDYTDINKTISGGLALKGTSWGRPEDLVGLAGAVNDASSAAKHFFAAGGLGILVGDGQLPHSGPEKIIETYYNFAAAAWLRLTLDYQFISDPAYSRDRGPVSVFGLRVHGEF